MLYFSVISFVALVLTPDTLFKSFRLKFDAWDELPRSLLVRVVAFAGIYSTLQNHKGMYYVLCGRWQVIKVKG